ncbi:hypothetical protein [Azospirillum brasilense]|uniref:hypothetical protein n=1 Tax=Azospirillum brasilense TaxID=192 RepID=UPI00190970DB|nr:hypothetical protein [Azospirillum brasilense]
MAEEPTRLPPPPFWRTRYFALVVMAKPERRGIDPLDVLAVLSNPVKRQREPSGRVRYWGWVTHLRSYVSVVTLEDGETVHNAFLNRDFEP